MMTGIAGESNYNSEAMASHKYQPSIKRVPLMTQGHRLIVTFESASEKISLAFSSTNPLIFSTVSVDMKMGARNSTTTMFLSYCLLL